MTSWFNLLSIARIADPADPAGGRLPPRISAVRTLLVVLTMVSAGQASAISPQRFPDYSRSRQLREDATLRSIAFSGPRRGLVCGDRGTILLTEDGGQSWEVRESGVECQLNDVLWIGDRRAIIVGGGYDRITQIGRAVILISQDGGRRWRPLATNDLPVLTGIQRGRDRRLIVTGDWSHAMLTDQFQSHDGGKSWKADLGSRKSRPPAPNSDQMSRWVAATGVAVAIRDACQVGDSTLMAVGDHGVILASPDGGRRWEASRGSGRQTSVLIVAKDRTSVAWGMLGKEAIEHRNRVSLLIDVAGGQPPDRADQTADSSTPAPPGPDAHPNASRLANQVTVMLGGASADQANLSGSDANRIATRWIAIHRPSVLVIDQSLDVTVQDAFIQAATSAGVARVAVYRPGSGSTVVHRDAMLPTSGVLVSDLASDAYQHVAPDQRPPRSIAVRFDYDVAPSRRKGGSVAGGVSVTAGQRLASELPATSRRSMQVVQARRTQSARVKGLIERSSSPKQFSGTLKRVLNQTAGGDQFRLAWTIYLETAALGQSPDSIDPTRPLLQQVVLREIADRFATTSAGQWARLVTWAQQHSTERNRLEDSIRTSSTGLVADSGATVPVSPFQDPDGPKVRQASAVKPVIAPKPEQHKLNLQRPLAPKEDSVDLSWEFHPLVLIAREASRQRGDHDQLQSVDAKSAEIGRLARSSTDRWSPLVRVDSRQTLLAHATSTPPKLDGILDDPCWQSAAPTADRSRLRISYDDQYLYVGYEISSAKLGPDSDATATDQRTRDRDLREVDRVEIRIDVDRDLLTSYRFTLSASGQTCDSVDEHRDWNPTWYRETRRENGRQTIELAILRRDLVDLPIRGGESWYVSASRLVAHSAPHPLVMPDPANWLKVAFR